MTRLSRLFAIATLLAAALVVGEPGASPVRAYPGTHVNLMGHGWGHGDGMGQWGAQGYATNHGWSHDQILNHYYGGTTSGNIGNPAISVHITRTDGRDMILRGTLTVDGIGGAYGAALVRRIGTNQFKVFTSGGCAGTGGWVDRGNLVGPVRVGSAGPLLALCETNHRVYRGRFEVVDISGVARLVNHLALDEYLYSVVPSEMPASWHAEALRAQAVAARSYAKSFNTYTWANQCDTIACQVYSGVRTEGVREFEASTTTVAVNATSGKVRMRGTAVAFTQFSSSTGGYTSGANFPAVPDAGDVISPHHNWTASVPVSAIESAYPEIGVLQSVDITQRNGLGDWGGRVLQLVLRGSAGSRTLSGSQFRSRFDDVEPRLKSDWFTLTGQPSGGVHGYWAVAPDGGIFTFGNAQFLGSMGGKPLNKPIVGMAAKEDGSGYWMVATDGGIFTFGTAGFFGSMGGKHLNQPIVGMAPTPSGNGYWLVASDGGIFTFGDARFLGSMGGTRLNKPVVGMASTRSGNGYWMVASDGGIFTFGDAAFRGSTGGMRLNQPVVGMAPTSDGNGYWLLAADGGIFAFNAPFHGSLPGIRAPGPAVDMRATTTNGGYVITTNSGHVYSFGDAPNFGGVNSVPGFRGGIEGIEVKRVP